MCAPSKAQRDDSVRHGRSAPGSGHPAHGEQVRPRPVDCGAEGAVQRVDHQAAPPTTTATRSRPAARASSAKCTWRSSRCERGSGFEFDTTRVVRRRDSEQLLPVDREGHPVAPRARPTGRLPGGRRALRGVRRQDAPGRLEGHRIPDRRPRGLQEDLPGRGPGVARADHGCARSRCPRSTWATS